MKQGITIVLLHLQEKRNLADWPQNRKDYRNYSRSKYVRYQSHTPARATMKTGIFIFLLHKLQTFFFCLQANKIISNHVIESGNCHKHNDERIMFCVLVPLCERLRPIWVERVKNKKTQQ